MRPALLLAGLMLGPLSGCRTVQTVALAPSLDAAVAEARGQAVRIERAGGPPLRNATRLALSDRMLSYLPENAGRRDSLPREQVRALTVHVGGAGTLGKGLGLVAVPSAIGLLVDFGCCFASNRTSGFGVLGIGLGIGANALFNPDRERVVYRAPAPRR